MLSADGASGKEASLAGMMEEVSASSVSSASKSTKERVRTNLIKVMAEAESGNQLSGRIAEQIDPKFLPPSSVNHHAG